MKLPFQIAKGILRHTETRRKLMFGVVLVAVVMLFCGSSLFAGYLLSKPLFFLIYWACCAGLTLLAILLAIYDLLRIRLDAAQEKRRLKEEMIHINKRL